MLQLKNITKIYGEKNEEKVEALKGISIEFRENEFVSILGQSGCGKTTLLNIVGGLDKYTTGDLIINEKSTKEFKDRDWDTYRNHSVGFVFQSYNLISHQSILSNVELALTLAGIGKAERKKRAKEALEKVGLGEKINKRPTELSGGQMQRVAIARALVSDPDILLADEPTGALDSATSVQIMELLKEISKDRLVIMVTHNPEIAEKYSTRIIKLLDGKVTDDSNPYSFENDKKENKQEKKKGHKSKKTYMKFTTALTLSFRNLLTKKGRTILTAFAGSIGIIGIALILSLSTGVREYIDRVQKETLSEYPLMIEKATIDMKSIIESNSNMQKVSKDEDKDKKESVSNKIESKDDITNNMLLTSQSSVITNNLSEFKKFLDKDGKNIKEHSSAIQYIYGLELQIYSEDVSNGVIKINPNTISLKSSKNDNTSAVTSQNGLSMSMEQTTQNNVFEEMIDSEELLDSQYNILEGRMPKDYNELVLIVDENNKIPESVLYALNMKDRKELQSIVDRVADGEDVTIDKTTYKYSDFIGQKYKLVINSDYYVKENGKWFDKSKDNIYLKDIISKGIDLEIVGVLKVDPEATTGRSGIVGYSHKLSEYVIEKSNESEIVKEQLAHEDTDIITGISFDINKYVENLSREEIEGYIAEQYSVPVIQAKAMISQMTDEELKETVKNSMSSSMSGVSLESNLQKMGHIDLGEPKGIYIYPRDFSSKESITDIIEEYNKDCVKDGKEADAITYTDYVGLMMSSVTTIINTITYILIAFVAISLIVSSIMIAIITYISVLERTKEIGILRSIGASKKDVSRVFNAETMIEGFIAGIIGIGVTSLLCIPINIAIKAKFDVSNIARLPLYGAIGLVVLSILLTVIAGLIPSKMAAKRDPAVALRTE